MQFTLLDLATKKALILPIPPKLMTVITGTKVLTFEPTVLGEIELPRGRLSNQFTLEGMLPGEDTPIDDRDSELTPDEVVAQFREWEDSKRPGGKELRFIVTETDWNEPVFLRNFEPDYSGGYGNVMYTLTLTEQRPFAVKEVKPESSGKKEVRKPKPKPKTHIVKKGDTLWAIAKKYNKKGASWTELWAANKKNLKSGNPNKIYPGEKVVIPAGWLK
ncbi:LysM peptidoglycan-binding domain-containing protein [Sporosarcina sp. FSL W7-1283]|uniref:LysM peptidoglycan-binding domain-containing protein n=1 Tax=Sporosarcina sp. FSL W7-1283 TaxID=2921560 RepID=UPI0030F8FE21